MFKSVSTPIIALVFLPYGMAAADEARPDTFASFGSWQTSCDAWGVPATCASEWHPGLHASHIVQTYAISRVDTGAQIFAGRGVYQISGGEIEGVWEDSRGDILRLGGTYQDGSLSVIWGEAPGEIGRSTYRFDEGRLSVRDFVLGDDGWRAFMSVDYAESDEE